MTQTTRATTPAAEGVRVSVRQHLSELDSRTWWILVAWVVIAATMLRFYDLDLKPLHHDEGVNGLFLTNLIRAPDSYRYDPANYHGPTLYYFARISVMLFGLTTFAIRFVPAFLGVLTVFLVLQLRSRIGAVGALSAATLVALSPGAVYLSRYFIHETLLVCFTVGMVVALARYSARRGPWDLALASASCGLMFATKETAVLAVAVLALAGIAGSALVKPGNLIAQLYGRTPDGSAGARRPVLLTLAATAPFMIVNLLFYSSFFTQWGGVLDAFNSFGPWARTGTAAHLHPWTSYLSWLWQEEAPVLVLGGLGGALAVWRRDDPFAVFLALWSLGILVVYSTLPYKTPWLTLNIIVPLAIVGGYGVEMITAWKPHRLRHLLLSGTVAALVVAMYQAIALNFVHYDDERYPYVYAHTTREILSLVEEIHRVADRPGQTPLRIAVTSREHFPLSWYLRNYPTGYYGQVVSTDDSIVIGSERQERELKTTLGDRYVRIGSYALRPGQRLVLYVRRDIINR